MSTSAARLMAIHKMRALSRPALTALLLLLAALALAIYALGSGALSLTAAQVIDALRGEGPANLAVIVTQWRLPRVIMALLLGAALGLSGAIFQSILRNPLGSPDVIGFNTGAYSGVLVAIVLFNGGVIGITAGALAGGLLTDRYLQGIPQDSRAASGSQFLQPDQLTEDKLGKIRRLNALAQQRGQKLSQMALAWVLRGDRVTSVLIGASKTGQIEDAVGMLANRSFSDDEIAQIEQIPM